MRSHCRLHVPAIGALCLAGTLSAQVAVDWQTATGGVAIAVDANDNVYTLDYTYALGAEMALTKRSPNGGLLWVTSHDQTDPTKWEKATWVATDTHDNVIVTGTLMSGYSNPVPAASIVMKFAPTGQLLWRRVFESPFDGSYTKRCLVDESDHIYVLGMGSGPAGFVTKVKKLDPVGGTVWTYHDAAGIGAPLHGKFAPDGDLLIAARSIYGSINGYARLDRGGNVLWSVAGVASLTTGDLASDGAGNTYLVNGEYVLNGGTVVSKLAPNGAVLWANTYPSVGRFVQVGNDDRPVVCGYANSGGGSSAFFKLAATGQLLWSNLDADGPLNLLMHAQLVLDTSNDAYLAAGTLFDMAVCKVNANGVAAWTATMPGGYANAITLGRATNGVYVVGGRTAHLLDPDEGFWTDLGQVLAGANGAPRLDAEGVLQQGHLVLAHVGQASPSTIGVWVAGFSAANLPLLGGLLVPSPDVVLGLGTDPLGRATLTLTVPSSLPSGFGLWLQGWFLDVSLPQYFSASNAMATTTP